MVVNSLKYQRLLLIFCTFWIACNLMAGELLGHLSEDELPPTPAVPVESGRLIYRVICSPEQQDEPDCERAPLEDRFEALQSKADRDAQQAAAPVVPDMPADEVAPTPALDAVQSSAVTPKHTKATVKSSKSHHVRKTAKKLVKHNKPK